MSQFEVGETLKHDHHAIDAEIARFRESLERAEWPGESLERAAEALRHHIYVEEEVLFPFLRAGGLVAPVFVMVREHAVIWRGLEALEACRDGAASDALAALASLTATLEPHNYKEEQILYPASGQVLDDEATEAVRRAFEESWRPGGWLPQGLR